MALQGVLDDGQSEPERLPRNGPRRPVKALGQPRMCSRKCDAGVDDRKVGALLVAPPSHANGAFRGVYLRPLTSRLVNADSISWARRTSRRPVELQEHMARPSARRQGVAVQPFEHARTSIVSRGASPSVDSSRDSSSKSVMMAFMRCACARMSKGPTGLVDAGVVGHGVEISGNNGERVRSSCDALATKSLRIASRRL